MARQKIIGPACQQGRPAKSMVQFGFFLNRFLYFGRAIAGIAFMLKFDTKTALLRAHSYPSRMSDKRVILIIKN